MNLKAYNGLMTEKGLKYVQDETIKRLPEFKKASEEFLNKPLNKH